MIDRNRDRCINCQVCVRQCANEAHSWDEEEKRVMADDALCVNCHRCVTLCPTHALTIRKYPLEFRDNANWTESTIKAIYKQSETGGILLTGMGNDRSYPIYWDHLLLNASQVTNPSIDPLREPMELKTFLGRKPDRLKIENGRLAEPLPPQLELDVPIMFSAMSFGSISLNAIKSLARAAEKLGIYYNTGEGGLHKDLYQYGKNTIVQVASGRFGVHPQYLQAGEAIEIKMGQGAKPGIGGHLPGEKVGLEVSRTRMIPEGSDAISPAPHHDIYSIEDLHQLIFSLKEATHYKKPISVKIAAVHNIATIASGVVRAGADIIAIDGFRGGTGAAPLRTRDNVGIPIELALAAVDSRLRDEGIRNQVSLVVGGRLNPDIGSERAFNLIISPNADLAKGTEIKVNRGIVVDEHMSTSVADVYAAGDVAEGYDILYRQQRVLPILPNAYKQGFNAGVNMAGKVRAYGGGFAMNSIGFFDLPMITAGIVKPEGEGFTELMDSKEPSKSYRKVVLREGRIVGYIALNHIDRAGILTGLMEKEVDVRAFQEHLLKEDFGYAYLPQEFRYEQLQ